MRRTLINHRSSVGYSWRKLFAWYFNFSFLMFTATMKAVFETFFFFFLISGIWLNLILCLEHGSFHVYLIKNIPCGLRYCSKIALYFPFFLEEFIKHGLKQYVGSVQVQVTLKLCLWNSPEGPGCLVPHDVMQALPFQQNNSVFTACN